MRSKAVVEHPDWINPITDFELKRQNLPHMQAPGSIYFTDSNTQLRAELDYQERQILYDSILFHNTSKYELDAAVVMPDHFHLLLRPLQKQEGYYPLPEIFHSIKSFSARKIMELRNERVAGSLRAASFDGGNKSKWMLKIFQDENYDHIIRNERDYNEKLWYIIKNPVEAGLVARAEDYPHLYCPAIGKI
jgi:putative transposase